MADRLQRPRHGSGKSISAGNYANARTARMQGQQNRMPGDPNPLFARLMNNRPGGMNQFFADAAMMDPRAQQQFPQMPGAGLGGMLALQFIMQNPQLKKIFEMQLQKMMVPQSAVGPQQGQMDQSLAAQLAMSQGLPRGR